MTEFTLRRAVRADLPHLGAIEKAAGAMFPVERVPDPSQTLSLEDLEQSCAEDALLVAEADGVLLGFAVCYEEEDIYLHLEELSVHPDHGRQGIGRALLMEVVALAQSMQLAAVTLTTFSDIAWNGPFYRSAGFTEIDRESAPDYLQQCLRDEESLGMTERVGMVFRL